MIAPNKARRKKDIAAEDLKFINAVRALFDVVADNHRTPTSTKELEYLLIRWTDQFYILAEGCDLPQSVAFFRGMRDWLTSSLNDRTQKAFLKGKSISRSEAIIGRLYPGQWEAILKAYRHHCAYCGRYLKNPTKDHVFPVAKGGKTEPSNIVPACQRCNAKKHTGPPSLVPFKRLFF